MKLGYSSLALTAATGLLLALSAAADDRVDYRDSKNRAVTVTATGTIVDENFTAVKLKSSLGNKEIVVPVSDLAKIVYDLPPTAKADFGAAAGLEEKQEYAKALDGYKALLSKVGNGERAKRFIEYKIAMTSAALAIETPATTAAAIGELKKFLVAHTGNWLTVNAARQLIALQLRANDPAGAIATADTWSKIDKLPKEAKEEADLARIDVLFNANRIKEAKGRAEGLVKGPAGGNPAFKAKLDLYIVAAEAEEPDAKLADVAKKIEDSIAKSGDGAFKAFAYNLLGDLYLLKGQAREAMWKYLWVDVVYNLDRAEQMKADDKLIRIFETEGMRDAERAKLFRDKFSRNRQ